MIKKKRNIKMKFWHDKGRKK